MSNETAHGDHPNEMLARDADIVRRVVANDTLQAIADDYMLTRERVRQIALRLGAPARREVIRAKAEDRRLAKLKAREERKADRASRIAATKALVDTGMSVRRAARLTGTPVNALTGYPSKFGRWRPELPVLRQQAVEIYRDQHLSVQEVALRVGMSTMFVANALHKAGIKPDRKTRVRGPIQGKVTPEIQAWAESVYDDEADGGLSPKKD